jgi:predicted nucleic acid binding AN1-type Zn finger protein
MKNKHKVQVKDMMENMVELSRDLFLNEQDICNMVGQLAKEMYKKHENGTMGSLWSTLPHQVTSNMIWVDGYIKQKFVDGQEKLASKCLYCG